MTRMFKRWISLLVCMFLPTMMFSFLYHRNEMLQKKIANSLQLDQRLFPKSLPADETSSSIWQRLAFPTPYYRVERDLDEQMWLPMAMSGMTSREVMRSTLTTKKTITTRAAIEVHSLLETEETPGTAERNVVIATGNDVSRAETPSKDIKKRTSKRPRRTNKRSPVHHQELPQQVGEDIFVKSVGVAGTFDDKQVIPTSAPVVKVPPTPTNIEEVAKLSEKLDSSAIASPVESLDAVLRNAATARATMILRSTAETENITEITDIANDDLDMKLVNETSFSGSIQASSRDKSSEQTSQSALSAPTKRKSKKRQVKSTKTKDRIAVQFMNTEQKSNETILDSKIETIIKKTDNEDGVVQTMQEPKENIVPVQPPSRKEDSKRKRDRKSRTRRKSHPKEVEVNVPVTLSLKFNLNDSNSRSPIILVSTNKAFLNFTDNWLESVKRSGIRSGVTLVAEDREAFNYLNNRTDIELNVVLNDVSESPGERLLFDSPAYKQLVNKRPSYILQLLSSGHDVLFSDVDIVWLKNPLPYFTNDTNDIWLQEDLHEPTVYCAGFTFYRSTPATIALVTEWVQNLALHPTYPDQRVLNGLLKKKRWQGDDIKRAVMDSRLFPSGRLYFDPDWREANKDTEQVMVHNNWIKGHDRKVERFKNEGLWYLDDKKTGLQL